jgi:hypothetical protein
MKSLSLAKKVLDMATQSLIFATYEELIAAWQNWTRHGAVVDL